MARRKALLVISNAFTPGGGISVVNRLVISSLLDQGFHLDIHAIWVDDPTIDAQFIGKPLTYSVYSGRRLEFMYEVWKAILYQQYDLIYSDHVSIAFTLVPLAKTLRVSYVLQIHALEVMHHRIDWRGKLALKTASKILCVSQYGKTLVQQINPNLNPIVCEPALPKQYILPSTASFKKLPRIIMTAVDGNEHELNERFILHVGRMAADQQHKGHDVMIYAMAKVFSRYPDAQLVLIGEGNDMPRLRKIARSLDIDVQSKIFMPGFIEDSLLDKLYQQCFLFAMPSRAEGFGLVYLEAMSYGKPCIGGNMDAAQHLIRHNQTGRTVNPTSAQEIAVNIIDLLEHPDLVYKMGNRSRQLVAEQYLFEHFKQRFLSSIGIG